jgi:putative copper export protein
VVPFLSEAAGWGLFLSLVVSIGTVVSRWTFLRNPEEIDPIPVAQLHAAAGRLGRRAALVLTVALLLVLLRQLLEFRDPFVPWTEDLRLLVGGTPWGGRWLAAFAGSILLQIAFWMAAYRKRGAWALATALALALGAFPALTGHANAGDLRWITLPADTLHIWAAGTWMGGLGVMVYLEWRHRIGGDTGSLLPVMVPGFSPIAMIGAGVLILTGLLASIVHLGGPANLLSTEYGRLLLQKLALVLVIMALGALNFIRIAPRLDSRSGQEAMRFTASQEFLVANLVLLVTALLVRTSPVG